jgi:predicted RNA polymerase sigma factor
MIPVQNESEASATVDAVARRSYGKLVAFLSARTRDVAAAEDALSEAFAAALADWPVRGCPDNPEGWLLTVARRKAIDAARGRKRGEAAGAQLELAAAGLEAAAAASSLPDERLGLLFACAHPAIAAAIRAPLMLQAVLGLEATAIASAFLVSPATMSQRLVRAKNKIREAGIPFRIPEREELPKRLEAVLEAIYAAFGQGWSETAAADAARRELAQEAIFLCRLVQELLPREAEGLGLLALLLHVEARRRARRNAQGEYVPLAEQDLTLWNAPMIAEAEKLLFEAGKLGTIGRFQLEAALQSAHVDRRRTGRANWAEIVQLYDALLLVSASPVVAINRAVALAETKGAPAALQALEAVAPETRFEQYQPYWAARADLLARTGAAEKASQAYEIAIGLERDAAVRQFLRRRQANLR